MSYLYNKSWNFVFGMMLVFLSGMMLFGFTQGVSADERGSQQQYRQHREPRASQVQPHVSQDRPRVSQVKQRQYMDSRYHHERSYPVRGQFIQRMPSGHRVVAYGKSRYYFHGGVWYRPYGSRFTVVAPPFGLIVPFLPPYYATVWFGGIPYYYANEVYYTRSADGYVIVEPPKGEASQTPSPAEPLSSGQLFIYPRQGQSEQQQATDRYECHGWAVTQTGYDPTKPPAGLPEDQMSQNNSDYQRAMGACLDGRGYTVK